MSAKKCHLCHLFIYSKSWFKQLKKALVKLFVSMYAMKVLGKETAVFVLIAVP